MSSVDSVSTAAAKPVRLVAGRWRTWLARWRTFLAGLAVALMPMAAVVIIWRLPAPGSWFLAIGYMWLMVRYAWLDFWRRFCWRVRWRWDARAGGLTRFAEKGVNLKFDRLDQDTIEVPPGLIRVRVDNHGNRQYTVRPLPGSSPDEYGRSAELLRTRWRAVNVLILPDDTGSRWARGRVVIQVVTGRAIDRPLPITEELVT